MNFYLDFKLFNLFSRYSKYNREKYNGSIETADTNQNFKKIYKSKIRDKKFQKFYKQWRFNVYEFTILSF